MLYVSLRIDNNALSVKVTRSLKRLAAIPARDLSTLGLGHSEVSEM